MLDAHDQSSLPASSRPLPSNDALTSLVAAHVKALDDLADAFRKFDAAPSRGIDTRTGRRLAKARTARNAALQRLLDYQPSTIDECGDLLEHAVVGGLFYDMIEERRIPVVHKKLYELALLHKKLLQEALDRQHGRFRKASTPRGER